MTSMRDYQRKVERPRLNLRRDADGRLRASSGEGEIGDIWAQQKRISLAEAIQEDKRRAEKKEQRRQKFSKLFKSKPASTPAGAPKEIVLNINVPKVKLPNPKITFAKLGKKRLLATGGVVAVLGIGVVGHAAYEAWGGKQAPGRGVLTAEQAAKTPDYKTVLPDGKSIEDLGGWAKVSPPGKDPVFAFADRIGSAQITVSQQPLPKSFKDDIAGSVADVAKQFGANETVKVDDATVYIGTSIKGPQSVILAKDGLLLLIKSDSTLDNDEWVRYVQTLH